MTNPSTAPAAFRPMLALGTVGGLLIVATLGLWAWYGTTMFFEILRAGWAACF